MLAAGVAMVVVQLFELFDGFGVMTNVHDHFDLVANTAGIAIAFAIDASCAAGPQETGRARNDANVPERRSTYRGAGEERSESCRHARVLDGLEPPSPFIVDEVRPNVALGDEFFLKEEMGGVRRPPLGPRPGAGGRL